MDIKKILSRLGILFLLLAVLISLTTLSHNLLQQEIVGVNGPDSTSSSPLVVSAIVGCVGGDGTPYCNDVVYGP